MLVRLYAGEIIMGRITEDNVPAKPTNQRRAASCGPPTFMR